MMTSFGFAGCSNRPFDDVSNRPECDIVLASKLAVRTRARSVFGANRVKIGGRELPHDPTLHSPIRSIHRRWRGKQVSGIDTSGVVTSVADELTLSNLAKGQRVRKPMRAPILDTRLSSRFELAVARRRATAYPYPTRELPSGFIDIAPESLCRLIDRSLPLPLPPIQTAVAARFLQTVREAGNAVDLLIERIGRQISTTVSATFRTKLTGHFADLLHRSVECRARSVSALPGFCMPNFTILPALPGVLV